jgi:hypothetical protein
MVKFGVLFEVRTEIFKYYLDELQLQRVNRTVKCHSNNFFQDLLSSLQLYAMTKTFLSSYLVSAACDGAAMMLRCNSGVAKLLKD